MIKEEISEDVVARNLKDKTIVKLMNDYYILPWWSQDYRTVNVYKKPKKGIFNTNLSHGERLVKFNVYQKKCYVYAPAVYEKFKKIFEELGYETIIKCFEELK